jgi:hypothetical protein
VLTSHTADAAALRDVPIEALARLLAAIARPCGCESGEPDDEVCVGPPDRWERRWADARA